jgi:hypothetical protein
MRIVSGAIIGFCLCALAPRAEAAILFAGGEDVDFLCNISGSCNVTTNSAYFRPTWAREAYYVAGNGSDPPVNRFATPVFTANSTIWIHAQFCEAQYSFQACGSGTGNGTIANQQLLRVIDNLGNPTLIIRGTGTAGQLKISSRTSSGTFTDLATCSNAFAANSPTQLDFYINYGSSGRVTTYTNSNQVCDYTGNVTNSDGATTLNAVEFAGVYGGNLGLWSEVIVSTTDTRAMNLYTLAPNGNGNATQWSGNNPCTSILNATTVNTSSYVYTGSNDQIEECAVTISVPPGNYLVPAVVMSMNGLVGAAGPQHFAFVTRIGNTDYASSNFALTNSFSNVGNYIQPLNSATGSPWSVSDLTASGFNIGLQSEP